MIILSNDGCHISSSDGCHVTVGNGDVDGNCEPHPDVDGYCVLTQNQNPTNQLKISKISKISKYPSHS
ncbi:unnamed protein product [Citrullus colocynthis]|uniref:Uncharacterized protein n=1 Tax=Citrullus colocynthis TaxID=252529 RepID=A0ABP0YPZ1_9ROSI